MPRIIAENSPNKKRPRARSRRAVDIACRPRRNGSMRAVLELQPDLTMGMIQVTTFCRTIVGISPIVVVHRIQLARNYLTRGGYMICMATFGNGVRTGTMHMPAEELMIQKVRLRVRIVFSAAAAPVASRTGVDRRLVTILIRPMEMPLSDSESCSPRVSGKSELIHCK